MLATYPKLCKSAYVSRDAAVERYGADGARIDEALEQVDGALERVVVS